MKKKQNWKFFAKLSKSQLFFITLIICFFVFAFIFFFLSYKSVEKHLVETYEKNASLKIGDYVGFNLDPDKLYFGTVFPGGNAYRNMKLESGCDCYVYINQEKVSSDWLFISDSDIRLSIGENELTFYAYAPENSVNGELESTVYVYVFDHKINFLTRALLKGVPVKATPLVFSEGSAKISLEIVNSS